MSLGGPRSQAVDDAVESAIKSGLTLVVAAGNNGGDACQISPAAAPNAITVGATDTTDVRASYSNYGKCVDVFAPGSSITSAWKTSDTAVNTISGTSMAAPAVAGVAALMLEGKPASLPAAVRNAIVNGASKNVVKNAGAGSIPSLLFSGATL